MKPTEAPKTPEVCTASECVYLAGELLAAMDMEAKPCQDFYQYACGGFEKNQNIPSGYNKYGSFDKARNLVLKELRKILEGPAPANEAEARKKSRDYYSECLDTDKIDTEGVPALQSLVQDMGGLIMDKDGSVPNGWTLDSLLLNRNKYSTSGFFSFYVGEDLMNVQENIIEVSQGGLGLGSGARSYYLGKDVETDRILKAYAEMLGTYTTLITGSAPDMQLMYDIVRFEKELAEVMLTNEQMRDPLTLYNKQNIAYLQANATFIDWMAFFTDVFKGVQDVEIKEDEPVLLYATDFILKVTDVINNYKNDPKKAKTLQNYAILLTVSGYAPSFGGALRDAYDKFQGVFTGVQGSLPRWQVCVEDTNNVVGFGLGAIYIEENFPEQAKDDATEVIERVTAAFEQRIHEVDWMDAETKEEALKKMGTLAFQVAYPEWLKDDEYLNKKYAVLDVTKGYVNAQFSAYTKDFNELFSSLRKGKDLDYWYMNPQTVNAYYSPTYNQFVVPAGILTPPFFQKSRKVPPAINFAAIGTVTGHEIGHGFDDSGSQFDQDGNLRNWWSEATLEEFNKKAQCLIDQYDDYGLKGKQTLGENIGDNGGIRASWLAYDTWRQENPLEDSTLVGLDLSSEQLFFVGYAQMWCSLYTDDALKHQIETNPHSPGEYRVIGPVTNSPDFAKAFNCKAGDPMNPPEEKKCEVW